MNEDDDDNENPPKKDYPLSPAKMSKTPSWIMLGFLLGALCVFALRPEPSKPIAAVAPPPAPAAPAEPRMPGPLSKIEATFEAFGQGAVWAEDKTEVGLWDPETERFADFYEIRKIGDQLYFRTIPKFTRRVINRGKPVEGMPLQFTETEEQYQEWVEYGRRERPIQRMWDPPARKVEALPPPTVQAPSSSMPVMRPPMEAPGVTTGGK